MAYLKQICDGYDPRLWFLLVATVVGGLVWMFKNVAPGVWDRIPQRLQALPATIIGAFMSAAPGQSAKDVVIGAAFGALGGVTAVGGFHFWDRLLSPTVTATPASAAMQPPVAGADTSAGKPDGKDDKVA